MVRQVNVRYRKERHKMERQGKERIDMAMQGKV
jgi:hypothetical protein